MVIETLQLLRTIGHSTLRSMMMSENLVWTKVVKETNELTTSELLAILKERVRVFVVEQDCAYQEVDDADDQAIHVILKNSDDIVAYARILKDNDQIKFGRVLVTKQYRGQHVGRKLIEAVLSEIERYFPAENIYIQAQSYLENFYASFGFETTSAEYLEDNIPHKDMVLKK